MDFIVSLLQLMASSHVLLFSAGAVELEKLPLKKDALRKLQLPFDVKSGEDTARGLGALLSRNPLTSVFFPR